jgi:transposase
LIKTNMTRTCGWAAKGRRLTAHVPHGHWKTLTFLADLRHDGLIAPRVLDGAMNRASFDACIKSQFAPALRPGQIVVAGKLSSHKSSQAPEVLRAQGNDLIFLPPYSPDLNPIEITRAFTRAFTRANGVHALIFSRLRTLIRKAAARTCHALWKQVGAACDLFPPTECRNCFMAAGYGSN